MVTANTVDTSLGQVALGTPFQDAVQPTVSDGSGGLLATVAAASPNIRSVDDLIRERTDPAIDLLRAGSEEQLRLSQLALQEGRAPLEAVDDLRAFEEQQALLGARGQEAQAQAISDIPVSEFDRELQRRQQQRLLRQANAAGELRSGATLEAAQQLSGAQQSDFIRRRLSQLEPLVAASRGVRTSLSQLTESGLANQAQLQSGLGTQIANIRLGATAPQIQSRLNEAELSGLRGISRAQQQGQFIGQLAGLAGQLGG